MVIIKFPDGSDWYKANWAFRQICDDAVARFPDDRELKESLARAQAYGLLSLDEERHKLNRTAALLEIVARETLAGKIKGWAETHPGDLDGQGQYIGALQELLRILERPANGQDGTGELPRILIE